MLTKDVEGTAVAAPPMETDATTPPGISKASPPKSLQIYIDGEFFDQAEAKVSVFDHGLLYGDGVFEGIRFYNGRVFRMEQHLDRLWESAHSICIDIPLSREAMDEALLETIRQNGLRDGYVRLIVTRGVGNLGLNPAQCKQPSIIIIASTVALYPEEVYRKGLTVVTVATRRMGPATLNPAIKSLNYLNNVLARIEANLANADEALMLNDAGNIAECTADNVFVVKHGHIMTPPLTAGALRGITRSVVFDIASELKIKISEPELTRHDLYIADEAFLTGTAAEVIPMIKVDGRTIGNGKPGPITKRTIERFRGLTRESGTPIFQE
jgi:branched-chain amino acid aminotransferase